MLISMFTLSYLLGLKVSAVVVNIKGKIGTNLAKFLIKTIFKV